MSKTKLPTGWSKSRIGDVVKDRIEQGLPEDKREFTYIDISAVDNRRKEIVEPKTLPITQAPSRARQQVKRGDVLVSTTRPNLNAVALVPPQLDGAIASTGFAVLRPVLLSPHWLFTVVQSDDFVAEMSALVKGALYPAIRPSDVHDYVMPFPPLAEQTRITIKLSKLLERIRNVNETLEALPELIQQYRATVLEAACTGRLVPTEADLARKEHRDFEPATVLLKRILIERRAKWESGQLAKMRAARKELNDNKWRGAYHEPASTESVAQNALPKGWGMVRLEQIAWSAGYGTSIKCAYEAKGPAVLRIPNVKKSQLVLDDLKFAENEKAVSSDSPLEPADFIIIRTNGSRELVGTGALIEKAFQRPHYFASYLIRYRLVSKSFHPAWLKMIWVAPSIRERVLAMAASTTGQYNVSLGSLNALEIPLPPLKEQKRIVAEVERRFRALNQVEFQVKAALGQITELRNSIFQNALSGNLVKQSRSDKPASELLTHIRNFKKATRQPTNPISFSGKISNTVSRYLGRSAVSYIMNRKDKYHTTIYAQDFRSLLHEVARAKRIAAGLRDIEAQTPARFTVSAKDLWKASGLTIDEFYALLKQEMGKSVREVGPNRLLEATA